MPSWATSTPKPSARSRAATAAAITCSSSITQISGGVIAAECASRVCTAGEVGVQIPCRAMHLRLIRNATLRLELDGRQLLVDPMLDPAGARPPVEDTENDRRNPLVELPEPAEVVVEGVEAVLATHLHRDHFDDTAAALLPRDVPLLCQPEDAERLRGLGFTDVRPVEDALTWEGIAITRTPARHGSGATAEALAPVSGYVLRDAAGRCALRRRRHRALRGRRGRARRARARTSSWSTRAARASRAATRS